MTVTLDEKIAAVRQAITWRRRRAITRTYPAMLYEQEQATILEAVLADLQAWRKLEPETTQAAENRLAVE